MLFLHLRQDLTGQLVSNLQEGWFVVSVLAGEMEEGGRVGKIRGRELFGPFRAGKAFLWDE